MDLESLRKVIDAAAADALRTRRIAGLTVAVMHKDFPVQVRGYGFADVERRIPATPGTVYGIGSMTKQFTATAVMQLVEQGLIGLDDPLTRHFEKAVRLQTPVTISHLLNHTAGIKGEADVGMLVQGPSASGWSKDSICELLGDELFDAAPGLVWRYSNVGYCLLGALIEQVTGESWADRIRGSVLHQAGLTSTWCASSDAPSQRLAQGYAERAGQFATIQAPSSTQTFSSGALYSTVMDLVHWRIAMSSGRVVRQKTYETMITPGALLTGETLGYGYGFFLGSLGDYREIGHDGTSGGYSSQLAHYPTAGLTVVVMTNSESHEAERIEKRISRHILGVPEPKTETSFLSATELAPYVGTYLYKGSEIPVYADSETLIVRTPGRRLARLVYQGSHRFVEADDVGISYEFTVHSHRSDGIVVSREGKTLATLRRLS